MENSVNAKQLEQSQSDPGGEGLPALRDRDVLPLSYALARATGVAAGLRERHADKSAGPDRDLVGPQGNVRREQATQRAGQLADLATFGGLLYELMQGSQPPIDISAVLRSRVPLVGDEGVRAAATVLALRCLGADGVPPPSVQWVLTEVRLYSLMARQSSRQSAVARAIPASPAPLSSPASEAAVNLPAREEEPVSPKVPLQNPIGTDPAPKLKPTLDPRWFLDPEEPSPLSDIQCPLCGGAFVYLSKPRNRLEKLLIASGVQINRCRRCFYRYVTILGIVFKRSAQL